MSWRRRGLPDDADIVISGTLSSWHLFTPDEQTRLLELTAWLLDHKHWEAAAGFVLDDTIRTVIAAQAAIPILGLSVDHYQLVTAVIVHPTTALHRGERAGPVPGTRTDSILPIHGLAQDRRGPVLIAWDQALAAARHPERGRNVVFHEFAHKIDMLDGIVDGTPPLDQGEMRRWVDVCTAVYDDLRHGVDRPPLSDYGATNPAEFFAVATESFFSASGPLRDAEPDLYDVLRGFYRQDPAART